MKRTYLSVGAYLFHKDLKDLSGIPYLWSTVKVLDRISMQFVLIQVFFLYMKLKSKCSDCV